MTIDTKVKDDRKSGNPYRPLYVPVGNTGLEAGIYVATYNSKNRATLWHVDGGYKRKVLATKGAPIGTRWGYNRIRALTVHQGELIFSNYGQIHSLKDYLKGEQPLAFSKRNRIDHLLSQGNKLSCVIHDKGSNPLCKVTKNGKIKPYLIKADFETTLLDVCMHENKIHYLTGVRIRIKNRWSEDDLMYFGTLFQDLRSKEDTSNTETARWMCSSPKGLYIASESEILGPIGSKELCLKEISGQAATGLLVDDNENLFHITRHSLHDTSQNQLLATFEDEITAACFYRPK